MDSDTELIRMRSLFPDFLGTVLALHIQCPSLSKELEYVVRGYVLL